MKAFSFRQGTVPWPPDESLLHVYAIPDLSRDTELGELVRACRAATDGYPLTHVTDRWLHITIAQISDVPAHDYDAQERAALTNDLETALLAVQPFTVSVGSCLAYPTGLIFDLHPDDQLNRVAKLVEAAIVSRRGPSAGQFDVGVMHLTAAYARGDADSDTIQRRLRRVRPSHAPMTINALHLVEVRADAVARTITWNQDTRSTLRLGAQRHPGPPSSRRRAPRSPVTAREGETGE